MRPLPDSALAVLRHLAEYRYLTADQLVRLGYSRSTNRSMNNLLNDLRELHKLVGQANFGIHPRSGKLPSFHYLTAKGVRLMLDMGNSQESIKAPKSTTTLFQRDYHHRRACLDLEISFKQFLKQEGLHCWTFDRYFDPSTKFPPKPFYPATKMILEDGTPIIPDAMALYGRKEHPYLVCFEVSMGRDADRVVEQLMTHVKALEQGTPSKYYNFPRGHFLACTFQYQSCMEATLGKLQQIPAIDALQDRFLFSALPNLKWYSWQGTEKPFYS